jgi:predicted phosphodiesterase
MANITHRWKRGMAWSCSHAKYCDKDALNALVEFRKRWKPDYVACLGDFTDMTAFMSGAKGTSAEAEPIEPDIDTGLMHLAMMRPNVVLLGNHEDRLYRLQHSHNAIVSYAASQAISAMEKACSKLKARIVPYDGIFQLERVGMSDIGLSHGTFYNEQAARDMAETYCDRTIRKIVFGHTHKVSIQAARTYSAGMGYNIGCLTSRGALEYAKTRRSTLAWTQGFTFFEFTDGMSSINLCTRNPNDQWRLPV